MVYECKDCRAVLIPGAVSCSECGQSFTEAVPKDVEEPKGGWQPKAETVSSPLPTIKPIPSASPFALPVDARFTQPSSSSTVNTNGRSNVHQNINRNGKVAAGIMIAVLVLIFVTQTVIRHAHPLVGSWVSKIGEASLTLSFSAGGSYSEELISSEGSMSSVGSYIDTGKEVNIQRENEITRLDTGTSEDHNPSPIHFAYAIEGDTMIVKNDRGDLITYRRQ